jgi:hypothetical protein
MEVPLDFEPCDKCVAAAQKGPVVKLCDDCAPKWSAALPAPSVHIILITGGHNAAGLYVSKTGVNFVPEYHEWKLSDQRGSAYRFFRRAALPVLARFTELGFKTELQELHAFDGRKK